MKILLAADGSSFTKKALGWILANQPFNNPDDELVVLHVQVPMPPGVRSAVGTNVLADYHKDEAEKVLGPIERLLRRHDLRFKASWVVGAPAEQILKRAKKEKTNLIVMGTHGRGLLGRALMGSIAQRVLADSTIPVLLVK